MSRSFCLLVLLAGCSFDVGASPQNGKVRVDVKPAAIPESEESELENRIVNCGWWQRKPKAKDLDTMVAALCSANDGTNVHIGDAFEIHTSRTHGDIGVASTRRKKDREFVIPVSGMRRWDRETALNVLVVAVEKFEFAQGSYAAFVKEAEKKRAREIADEKQLIVDRRELYWTTPRVCAIFLETDGRELRLTGFRSIERNGIFRYEVKTEERNGTPRDFPLGELTEQSQSRVLELYGVIPGSPLGDPLAKKSQQPNDERQFDIDGKIRMLADLAIPDPPAAVEPMELKMVVGETVTAIPKSLANGILTLDKDGKISKISISQLDEESQNRVRQFFANRKR